MWQLVDNSDGERKGWLTITKDGVRVADAFPYTNKAPSPQWVREQAQRIVDAMNERDMVPTMAKTLGQANENAS